MVLVHISFCCDQYTFGHASGVRVNDQTLVLTVTAQSRIMEVAIPPWCYAI